MIEFRRVLAFSVRPHTSLASRTISIASSFLLSTCEASQDGSGSLGLGSFDVLVGSVGRAVGRFLGHDCGFRQFFQRISLAERPVPSA
jgi:hypothetical protein